MLTVDEKKEEEKNINKQIEETETAEENTKIYKKELEQNLIQKLEQAEYKIKNQQLLIDKMKLNEESMMNTINEYREVQNKFFENQDFTISEKKGTTPKDATDRFYRNRKK